MKFSSWIVMQKEGQAFVWSAEDWLTLRKDHRIIGELIGCLPKKSRQDILHGLPLMLLPEEATLLLEKNIARLIYYPCLLQKPSKSLKKIVEEYRGKLFVQQEECLRQERRNQLIKVMDKIVDGKRRKILGVETAKKKLKRPLKKETQEALNNIDIDREVLMSEEMAKLPKLEKSEALVQTHTAYPWLGENDTEVAIWKYPSTMNETLRYKTYKDLWERGFYVSSGEKFGGDFLAYPGDPIMFHSLFIIECKDKDKDITIMELAGQCRVACHVRKTQVFATFDDEDQTKIKYQSFQWAESNMFSPV
ncbi:tRNA-splicing endonuclease subunit Sen34 [Venturia canescens]|uniref:tRNA-splicing endonuclease subunit Sen34 n=1 Tax=Venturia canescens TaxID=32260 RepID=UPI001C9CA9EB|nr:tRNA-splicing endonuclease subunit Sen34 [Venturia canescens]